MPGLGDAALGERQDRPQDFKPWKEVRRERRTRLESKHRNLADDVSCIVGDVEVVERIASQADVLLHSRHVGICPDVGVSSTLDRKTEKECTDW